jgi:hypothetical protein
MGSKVIKTCDACKRESNARNVVMVADVKLDDGTRIVGDLCQSCANRMVKEFGLVRTARQRRAPFKVVDYDEIVTSSE